MAKATSQSRQAARTKPQVQTPDEVTENETAISEVANEPRLAVAPAYRTFLEARRSLAQAFKDREYRDQEAYKDAERRYRACAEMMDTANRTREKAELDAADEYRDTVDKTIERATEFYREKTKQALAECRQTVMEAWKQSRESVSQPTPVCEEAIERAMKVREKTELDALSTFRQEVDRSVDRASQEYKDKLARALVDCKRNVADAWRISMEASARMTGVFEEDRTESSEERTLVSAQPATGFQLRAGIRRANGRLALIARRSARAVRTRFPAIVWRSHRASR